ncbi:GerAB/ArcD/ProY family transporter [Virgibacillus sp. MG-45]|uniref:GerAB/ArcD/ProY family transporter n=1 Tax=Virgibacillus sp. MG-45 TaxID=3102791 RepID=UPI002ED92C95
MDIQLKVKKNIQFRASYLFFILASTQIGVGIMGAPRYIFQYAKQDSWISILISFLFMIVVMFAMLYILRSYGSADIFGIQVDLFGSIIGKILGTVYIVYFLMGLMTVLLTYIETVRLFLYPTLSPFVIAFLLLSLAIYAVYGGIRVTVGVTFLFFLLSQWVLLLLYDPVSRMEWEHFLPMFQTPTSELLKGAKETTFTLSGFEIVFLLYPFVHNKDQIKKPIFFGISFAAFILFILTIISIGYYSLEDLENIEWSVLTLFKGIKYTFIERLDYVVVVEWMMVIIPNTIMLLWGITHGIKRLYSIPSKYSVYFVCGLLLLAASIIKDDAHINKLTGTVSEVGFWIVFIYPLVLLPIVWLKRKNHKKKGSR